MMLTELEKQSSAWIKLTKYANDRLDACRQQNDGDLSPEQTARLRGRIAALKEILALTEQVQPEPDE